MIILTILFSLTLWARDITPEFQELYKLGTLSSVEVESLKGAEVVLIPGIMSETFISDDPRSHVDLSFFTKDYFGPHLDSLERAGVKVRRLWASSASVRETRKEIHELLEMTPRPLYFIGHSLGGMALLDHLLSHEEHWDRVAGVIFLQSPFSGAPVASVVQRYPKLAKIFPLVHTSTEVVRYLSNENRKDFISTNEEKIRTLASRVSLVTIGGIANGHRSFFSTSVTLIQKGCLRTLRGKCVGKKLYSGPYDQSDGMVPFEGSKLPGVDFVTLTGTDHGESVVNAPFRDLPHGKLTAGLLRLLLPR